MHTKHVKTISKAWVNNYGHNEGTICLVNRCIGAKRKVVIYICLQKKVKSVRLIRSSPTYVRPKL